MISPEEWKEWAHHPLTQELKQRVLKSQADACDAWGKGNYTGETSEKTALANAFALGGIDFGSQIVELLEAMEKGESV